MGRRVQWYAVIVLNQMWMRCAFVCTLIAAATAEPLVLVLQPGQLDVHHKPAALQPDRAVQVPIKALPVAGADTFSNSLLADDAFVSVGSDLQFQEGCRRFVVAGFNANDLTEVAMVNVERFTTVGGKSGRRMVGETLAQARGMGLNVMRTWAHTSEPKFPFQVAPGVYAESGLRALDFVLHTATQHNLRVILSLADNWKYYNGVDQLLVSRNGSNINATMADSEAAMAAAAVAAAADIEDAAEAAEQSHQYEAERHALFFSDQGARQLYKNHVATLTSRRNSINGRLYRNDPVIMAWDLVNEPRCDEWASSGCPAHLQAWVEEMSAYVKLVAPRQMVAIGSEGFFGGSTPRLQRFNPAPWAAQTGQDFLANTGAPSVDFATIHMWPDNWETSADYAVFLQAWLKSHVRVAQQRLRKPLLLEEFGKRIPPTTATDQQTIAELRDPVFVDTYDAVQALLGASNNSSLAASAIAVAAADRVAPQALTGSLFWKWQVPVFVGSVPEDYGVFRNDSTMDIIQQHAAAVRNLDDPPMATPRCSPACWVGITAAVAAMQGRAEGRSAYQPLNASAVQMREVLRPHQCANVPAACRVDWALPAGRDACSDVSVRGDASEPCGPQPNSNPDAEQVVEATEEHSDGVQLFYEDTSHVGGLRHSHGVHHVSVLFVSPYRSDVIIDSTKLLRSLQNSTSARGLQLLVDRGPTPAHEAAHRLRKVFATQQACCMPSMGAFKGGCETL